MQILHNEGVVKVVAHKCSVYPALGAVVPIQKRQAQTLITKIEGQVNCKVQNSL